MTCQTERVAAVPCRPNEGEAVPLGRIEPVGPGAAGDHVHGPDRII